MGKVYASSDWHGCWDPAYKVLNFLKSDDKLYFLGDATDRGKDGIKIFQELINRPNTFYIKGNHDQMMADAIPFIYEDVEDISYYKYNENCLVLWYENGGEPTSKAFWNMSKTDVFTIKKIIDNMPTEIKYKSPMGHTVILEHAGYSPFNISYETHNPLWDRGHFYDNWTTGIGPSEIARDTYLVHGHTPVQYLEYTYGYKNQPPITKEKLEEKRQWYESCSSNTPFNIKPIILRYCNGHKFDIDMCTVASNRIALLDLDTFETIYFDKE